MSYNLVNQNIPASQVSNVGNLGENNDLFVAFSPGKDSSKKYSEQFSAGIADLRKSGKLKQILDRYNVKDWK
jgi:ABC-type amino acid transport substrate-binding protein